MHLSHRKTAARCPPRCGPIAKRFFAGSVETKKAAAGGAGGGGLESSSPGPAAGAGQETSPDTTAPGAAQPADVIQGRVLDSRSRTPVPGAEVQLIPDEETQPVARSIAERDGRFSFAEPAVGTYRIQVDAFGYVVRGSREIRYDGGVLTLDLAVLPSALEAGGIDVVVTRPAVVRDRTQIISGHVLDGENDDEPIAEIEVVLRNVRDEVLGLTTTDHEGHFSFAVADPGLYRLALRRIGYSDESVASVAVTRDNDVYVELRARPTAIGLGEIRVSAPEKLPMLESWGFYRRRELGPGDFYDPRQVAEIPAVLPSQLFRRLADVMTAPLRGIWIQGTVDPWSGRPCSPDIVLDGHPLRETSIDDLLPKNMIRAVEVYKRPGEIPQRWVEPRMCALIVVWTEG